MYNYYGTNYSMSIDVHDKGICECAPFVNFANIIDQHFAMYVWCGTYVSVCVPLMY